MDEIKWRMKSIISSAHEGILYQQVDRRIYDFSAANELVRLILCLVRPLMGYKTPYLSET